MATTRSFTNAFEMVDYTGELLVVPNQWSVLNDIGLFEEQGVAQNTVTFEEINKSLGLIGDQVRGTKPQAGQDYTRKIRAYSIPHFPYVDAIRPQDVQGKRAYGSDQVETVDAVMARKLERMRWSFDATLEVARWKTLADGTLYAPNGTIAGNLYADFNITRKSVNFALGTGTTDIIGKVEEVIAWMQDNQNSGDVVTMVDGFASPQFFAALVSHPKVQAAYQYYTATTGQQIQRSRAGNSEGVAGGLHRVFEYGGIRFTEVRSQLAGTKFVADNTCIFVPRGTRDNFVTYFGPADKFGYENQIGVSAYAWTYRDPKNEAIEIEGQSNFINLIRRPQMVVTGTVA